MLIEPIEILLDKPRKMLINHASLRKAETAINKMRFAKPIDYTSIDGLMVEAFNNIFRTTGMLPRDLVTVMIWTGLLPDKSDKGKEITIEQVDDMLENAQASLAEISGTIWGHYFLVMGKNLKQLDPDDEKKTTTDPDQPTGSDSSAPGLSSLN